VIAVTGWAPATQGKQNATLQSGLYRAAFELRRGDDKEAWKHTEFVQLRNEQGKITITDAYGISLNGFSAKGKLDGEVFTGELDDFGSGKPACQGKISAPNELTFTFKGKSEGRGTMEGSIKLVRIGDLGADYVRELKGMKAAAVAVCYSPDGKYMATGTNRGTVHVWDAATGAMKHTMRLGSDRVYEVCFRPDSKQLAACSDYGEKSQLGVWDVATGKQVFPFKRHGSTKTIRSIAYSPDGKLLASASDDQTIVLWDTATGKEAQTLKGHTRAALAVAFGSNGKLTSGSADKTVKIWDPAAEKVLLTITGNDQEVGYVCISPDGKLLAYAIGSTSSTFDSTEVSICDMATGKEIRRLRNIVGRVYCVAFHPDSKRIAVVAAGAVKLWDAPTGKELGLVAQVQRGTILSAGFSPDGKELAYAGGPALVWTALDRLTGTGRNATSSPAKKDGPKVQGKTVSEWVDLLKSSVVQEERRIAIYWLSRFEPPAKDAIPALLETMKEDDDDYGVSRYVPGTLGSMGAVALPAVEQVLKNKSPRMRQKAVHALSEMVRNDTKRPLELLIEVLKNDSEPSVRSATTGALSLMLQQGKAETVKAAVPALREALKVKDDDLVMVCAHLVNRLGKEAKSAAPELLAVIKDKEREEFVRSECVSALGYIGADAKEVVDVLVAALKDPSEEVRRAAGPALLKIDPEAAKKAGVKSPEKKKKD
jgi:WD40 repeat protein